ncbi:MAG: extracellular solute-binding protein [Spirochaetales bacterium]|nr:extracellular solute-binding protein [Spirochaetales bacterium]
MRKIIFTGLVLLMVLPGLFAGGAKEEMPAEDGVTTISIVAMEFPMSDPINAAHVKQIEEGFEAFSGKKIAIEMVPISDSGYAENLNLMILGGNIPDLIYFQGGDEVIANQGLLMDFGPYVEKSKIMQNALLDFNKERLSNYPYLLWLSPPRLAVAVVRQDWFEEIGGEIPVTVDDYYNMFKAIKNNHPDSFVMTDTGNTKDMDFTFNHAFGITATWLKQGSGYVYSKVSDAEKSKLEFYQKLYAEGLLDPEYITTKWDTKEDKLYTNRVGMVYGRAGIVCDIYNNKLMKNQNVGLVPLPPAKGVGQGYSVSSAKETRGWGVSATSKNPDLVFELLEYLASDEGQYLDRYGVEGTHYNVVDGTIEFTAEKSNKWPRFHEVMNWDAPKPLLGEAGLKGWEFISEYSSGDPDFPIPEDLSPTWDALENLYKEYSYKIISGEYSIDKFDEFVKEWYDLGGDKITEYAQGMLK